MYRRLLIITGIFSLVLIIGCSNEPNNTVEEPTKVEQETNTNGPANREEEADSETPQEDNVVETDPAVMADFQALVDKKAAVAELKSFVDSQTGKVSNEDYTAMVLAFEDLQQDQLLALEDRFYNGADFQEQLWESSKNGFDFSQIDTVSNPDLKKLLMDTRDGGYKVETAEGAYFPIIDYEGYVQYQAHVSEDIRDYIEIKAIESKEVSVKDAGMAIGWGEAVGRAVRQESFIVNHPSSFRIDEMKRLFGGYVYVTFNGLDNTPLFSYEDETVVPEAKTAYTDAVKSGTDSSPYLKRLSVLLDLIEKSGNKKSEEVMNYQQETTELWYNSNF
ncbi:MAG: hypothetical protein WD424_03015 [Paenibacillaceae bacterium]